MLPAGLAIVGFSPRRWPRWRRRPSCRAPSSTSATCAKDQRHGRLSLHAAVGLMNGLRESLRDAVRRRARQRLRPPPPHRRGRARAVAAWGLKLVRQAPELYSDTVSAIFARRRASTPPHRDPCTPTPTASPSASASASGGQGVPHRASGQLTDVMALSGIATIEMAMADLGLPDDARLRRRRRAGLLSRHSRVAGAERRRQDMKMLDDDLTSRPMTTCWPRMSASSPHPPHAGPDLETISTI
jgi:alanine-glyoxylate transaminase/serine-glyoxylate transaminase/serine-pyruvate transaminase